MKWIFLMLIISPVGWLYAQSDVKLAAELRDLNGNPVEVYDSLVANSQATLKVFWKSNDARCCYNIEDLQNAWAKGLKEKGVRLVAVCVDCQGSVAHIKPYVMGKSWDFEVFIDTNGDFMRSMGISVVPYTVLLDNNMNRVCGQAGWCSGDDEIICKKVLSHINQSEK